MGVIDRFLHSFIFWGAWIIIPVIMETIPSVGGFLLLVFRRFKMARTYKRPALYPEISIIIPVYNSQDTLDACIRSVGCGTYPADRIRIFLVNNRGKDNSFNVFKQAQEKYPKLRMQWLNAEQGKSRALNLALYNSEGKYIINLDSDGVLEPHALMNLVDKFEANPKINCMTGAVLTTPSMIEDYPAGPQRLLRKLEFMEYGQAFLAGRSFASETNSLYTLSGAFSAFRKSVILKSRMYNTNTICEDTHITFQMRYIQKEKVEICENAIFFVDPIEGFNKLYTQRQRWQRGSLEVAKQFLNEKGNFGKNFLDVSVNTLLYDHTFAFPRLIWYLAMFCLLLMNYSAKMILLSTGFIFAVYILVGLLYFLTVSVFLKDFDELGRYYRKNWWVVLLLPFFNFMVFFIRMAGIVNSIGTDSAWKTNNLSDEGKAFWGVIKEEMRMPAKWIGRLRKLVNEDDAA
ncbi:MAG: putative glycosyltransferase, exosortase G system-associated [Lachnospiraceae bacterium]|jgi:putative glycosyltransferase (exosortase G-associated)|nr:putative glycosyltransferase, exosortase G system-associated [Lachnospiraceae bacterium]